jgi:hypothetical protein
MASICEPWQAFFVPSLLARDLRAMGFGHVKDNEPNELNAKYCENRKEGLRVESLSHLIYAEV